VNQLLTRVETFFLSRTGDRAASQAMSLQVLEQARTRQALSLAYFDVFTVSAAVGVLLIGFVLLMRRSVAEKGAHIGAE
jgi:DHA2 family multidrug resistance protein